MSNRLSINKNKEFKLIKKLLFSNEKITKNDVKNINFEKLTHLTSSHLIIPLVYSKIIDKKCSKFFPNNFIKYFKEIWELNMQRNEYLLKEANEISELFREKKIKHVFIKGTSNILSNLYENIGDRMLSDIDILVEEKSCFDAFNLLEKKGYYPVTKNIFFQNSAKHLIRQANKNKVFAVEIHRRPFKKNNINVNKILSNRVFMNGVFVPRYLDQILINIKNHQINDYGYYRFSYSLRSIYDTFILIPRLKSRFKSSKYVDNYFFIIEQIKFFKQNIVVVNNDRFRKIRFNLVYKYKIYAITEFKLISAYQFLLSSPIKIKELIFNINYRKYYFEKILRAFKRF